MPIKIQSKYSAPKTPRGPPEAPGIEGPLDFLHRNSFGVGVSDASAIILSCAGVLDTILVISSHVWGPSVILAQKTYFFYNEDGYFQSKSRYLWKIR